MVFHVRRETKTAWDRLTRKRVAPRVICSSLEPTKPHIPMNKREIEVHKGVTKKSAGTRLHYGGRHTRSELKNNVHCEYSQYQTSLSFVNAHNINRGTFSVDKANNPRKILVSIIILFKN